MAKEGYVTKNPIMMMRRVNVVFKMKPLIVVRRLLLLLFIIIVFLFISKQNMYAVIISLLRVTTMVVQLIKMEKIMVGE